jgi:hypothetical protein
MIIMSMKVKVYHNGDDVFVAWKAETFIEQCRGFALMRKRNGIEEVVSTWVGFAGEDHKEGERRASTNWPIQEVSMDGLYGQSRGQNPVSCAS